MSGRGSFPLTKNDESDKKEWVLDEQKTGGKIPLRCRHSSRKSNIAVRLIAMRPGARTDRRK